MSVDILRRAAALMRERADAATPGCWLQAFEQDGEVLADGSGYAGDYYPSSDVHIYEYDGHVVGEVNTERPDDAAHIASWHPAVALAVADWLELQARRLDGVGLGMIVADHPALAVARAYLGEDQ